MLYGTHVVSTFGNLELGKGKLKVHLNTCHIFLLNFKEDPRLREEAY